MTVPAKIRLFVDFDGDALPSYTSLGYATQRTVQKDFVHLFAGQRATQNPNDSNSDRMTRFEGWLSSECSPSLTDGTNDQPTHDAVTGAVADALTAYEDLGFDHYFTLQTSLPSCLKVIYNEDGTVTVSVNWEMDLVERANFEGIPAGFVTGEPPRFRILLMYGAPNLP